MLVASISTTPQHAPHALQPYFFYPSHGHTLPRVRRSEDGDQTTHQPAASVHSHGCLSCQAAATRHYTNSPPSEQNIFYNLLPFTNVTRVKFVRPSLSGLFFYRVLLDALPSVRPSVRFGPSDCLTCIGVFVGIHPPARMSKFKMYWWNWTNNTKCFLYKNNKHTRCDTGDTLYSFAPYAQIK